MMPTCSGRCLIDQVWLGDITQPLFFVCVCVVGFFCCCFFQVSMRMYVTVACFSAGFILMGRKKNYKNYYTHTHIYTLYMREREVQEHI